MCKNSICFSAPPPSFALATALILSITFTDLFLVSSNNEPSRQALSHGGGHRGRAPPSEDCAPKKVTVSAPLESGSRPETPKLPVITPEFVSKYCFFADFAIKAFFWSSPQHPWNFAHVAWLKPLLLFFFLVFSSASVEFRACCVGKTFFFGLHPRICDEDLWFLVCTLEFEGKQFLCPPKKLFMPLPPSHATLAPGLPLEGYKPITNLKLLTEAP